MPAAPDRVEPPADEHDAGAGGFTVRLEVFEGPFDLLLQLIAGRRLDIAEVDLADITADFLAHLAELVDVDLETATRFLVVAATLIELKAARLLPSEHPDELEDLLGQARDVLYARLLEYRAVREAGHALRLLLETGERRHARDVPLPPTFQRLVPEAVLPIDLVGLATLAAASLAPRPVPHVEIAHIRRTLLSLQEAARQVLAGVGTVGTSTRFSDVAQGRSRADRVVLFLALLELAKLGHLDLRQPTWTDPIELARLEGGEPLDLMEDDSSIDRLNAVEMNRRIDKASLSALNGRIPPDQKDSTP